MRIFILIFLSGLSGLCLAGTILLPASDASGNSAFIILGGTDGRDNEATLIMYCEDGHSANEYGDVQISHDGGNTWQDLYQRGVQMRLYDSNVAESVRSPGVYRVQKGLTTNPCGIWASEHGNL